jgi:ankyrin repeat protein
MKQSLQVKHAPDGRKPCYGFDRPSIPAGSAFLVGVVFLAQAVLGVAASNDSWSLAIVQRDLSTIERLVTAGADVNRTNGDGMTALMVACAEGDESLRRLLIKHGARVNAANDRGGTPLMYSATVGDLDAVEFLLARGALVNAHATNGWTALTLAAARGFDQVATVLLAHGADPNVRDIYGWTPLMRAVEHERRAVVQVLLDSDRVNLDVQNENGHTALHHAALEGLTDIARMLVAHGADVKLRDHAGRTSMALAIASGHRTTAEIIGEGVKKE